MASALSGSSSINSELATILPRRRLKRAAEKMRRQKDKSEPVGSWPRDSETLEMECVGATEAVHAHAPPKRKAISAGVPADISVSSFSGRFSLPTVPITSPRTSSPATPHLDTVAEDLQLSILSDDRDAPTIQTPSSGQVSRDSSIPECSHNIRHSLVESHGSPRPHGFLDSVGDSHHHDTPSAVPRQYSSSAKHFDVSPGFFFGCPAEVVIEPGIVSTMSFLEDSPLDNECLGFLAAPLQEWRLASASKCPQAFCIGPGESP